MGGKKMNEEKMIRLNDIPSVDLSQDLLWEGCFEDYLNKCIEYPLTVRTAHQRLYDALSSYGSESYIYLRNKIVRYNVFDDPFTSDQRYAIYGRNVDTALMKMMKAIKAASRGLGQEKRILLLRGPVGTAKTTFSDLMILALEDYTKKPEGQLFSLFWEVEENDEVGMEILGTITRKFQKTRLECPLHEEPLRIFPIEIREKMISFMNSKVPKSIGSTFFVEGNACPLCNSIFHKMMQRYKNNWKEIIERHVRVKRYTLNKSLRQGIVIARPKSEKDQDVAEFLGSTNYVNLGAYGSSTDPRTYDFKGHYMSANRGFLFFDEWLKFALAFLYDCLGASQEHRVQPKGFMEVDVDLMIFGSTNEPEYEKLRKQKEMEALRDRTIVIDFPYVLKHKDEVRIYRKFFASENKRGGKHLAPRTLHLAAYWVLLTRLKKPIKANLDLRKKLRLYDGRTVEGFDDDAVKELMNEYNREGLEGISSRFINDKLSYVMMTEDDTECVDFFNFFQELEFSINSMEESEERKESFKELLNFAKDEMKELILEDIQEAATHDELDLERLFRRYLDLITAFVNKEKVSDVTGDLVQPDEEFMRSIEDKIQITEHEDFRQKITNLISKRALQRERDKTVPPFDFRTDERLYRALRLYLFSQLREKINWERLISSKVLASSEDIVNKTDEDRLVQQIKNRLINGKFGSQEESYCDHCATKILAFYASEFARAKKHPLN